MECLPGSSLPDDLCGLGYDLVETGEGERILPVAITEKLAQSDDGWLGPVTAGSTRPGVMVVRHAGIARADRYAFPIK
jgi:hypothetical protein